MDRDSSPFECPDVESPQGPTSEVDAFEIALSAFRTPLSGSKSPARASPPQSIFDPNLRHRKNFAETALLEERHRMARDLHDTFPQEFQVIIMYLRLALGEPDAGDVRLHVARALQAAEGGLRKARGYITALREPQCRAQEPALAWQNLDCLVREAAKHALQEMQLTVKTRLGAASHLISHRVATEVAAIVAEASTNAGKHSDVSYITCATIVGKGELAIEVRDKGRGFYAEMLSTTGFGLRGMRERAEAIGATLKIKSSAGAGTTVRLVLQLPSPNVRLSD